MLDDSVVSEASFGRAPVVYLVDHYAAVEPAYALSYRTFLTTTDQKRTAASALQARVSQLKQRRLLVDVGAGDGIITGELMQWFDKTILIEPNPAFQESLKKSCIAAELWGAGLFDVPVLVGADMVVCSHVLFHIPDLLWISAICKMLSWLAPSGLLVVLLQAPETEYRELLEYFGCRLGNLRTLARALHSVFGNSASIEFESIRSQTCTRNLGIAYEVAQFMINESEDFYLVTRDDLESFLKVRFKRGGTHYRLSCDQDILTIRNSCDRFISDMQLRHAAPASHSFTAGFIPYDGRTEVTGCLGYVSKATPSFRG
jgi:Methyltransferase domain